MRQTKKYVQGLRTLRALPDGQRANKPPEHDKLYALLEQQGYAWDSDAGQWQQRPRFSFEEAHGDAMQGSTAQDASATGLYRIRIMGHPADAQKALSIVQTAHRCIEVSDPYPNRRDAGVRVYVTCLLGDGPAPTRRRYILTDDGEIQEAEIID